MSHLIRGVRQVHRDLIDQWLLDHPQEDPEAERVAAKVRAELGQAGHRAGVQGRLELGA